MFDYRNLILIAALQVRQTYVHKQIGENLTNLIVFTLNKLFG